MSPLNIPSFNSGPLPLVLTQDPTKKFVIIFKTFLNIERWQQPGAFSPPAQKWPFRMLCIRSAFGPAQPLIHSHTGFWCEQASRDKKWVSILTASLYFLYHKCQFKCTGNYRHPDNRDSHTAINDQHAFVSTCFELPELCLLSKPTILLRLRPLPLQSFSAPSTLTSLTQMSAQCWILL